MWSFYPTGRIDAFCIWYVRLDFQYICDVIVLLVNCAEYRLMWGESSGEGIATHWTTEAPLQWSLAKGILRWPVVSPHTGPVMSSISGIIWHSCVFDSVASQLLVQKLVWTNMKEGIAFVRRNHREQMETLHTGTALRKHLIKHQRYIGNAKSINQTAKLALLIACKGICQWKVDSTNTGPAIQKA